MYLLPARLGDLELQYHIIGVGKLDEGISVSLVWHLVGHVGHNFSSNLRFAFSLWHWWRSRLLASGGKLVPGTTMEHSKLPVSLEAALWQRWNNR